MAIGMHVNSGLSRFRFEISIEGVEGTGYNRRCNNSISPAFLEETSAA